MYLKHTLHTLCLLTRTIDTSRLKLDFFDYMNYTCTPNTMKPLHWNQRVTIGVSCFYLSVKHSFDCLFIVFHLCFCYVIVNRMQCNNCTVTSVSELQDSDLRNFTGRAVSYFINYQTQRNNLWQYNKNDIIRIEWVKRFDEEYFHTIIGIRPSLQHRFTILESMKQR